MKSFRNLSKKNKGPLAIEILIVLIILILLLLVTIPNFMKAQRSADIAQVLKDMNSIHLALESYNTDYKSYPLDYDSCQIPNVPCLNSEILTYNSLTTPINYLTVIPFDVFLLKPYASSMKEHPHYEYAGPGTYHVSSPKWMQTGTQWTLVSVGPDLLPQMTWRYDPITVKTYLFCPTNGMKSSGDIYASNNGVLDPYIH